MFKKIIPFIAVLLIISLTSCGEKKNATTTQTKVENELSVQEFAAKIQSDTTIQLVDVRTWGEYMERHLKNAKWIDYYKPDFMELVKVLDPEKPVYLYCRTGRRSFEALRKMENAGFKNVVHLKGGITAWQSENMPTTRN